MLLHVLPPRTAGAAENMASDFLLLQRYPDATHARFRHYEWSRPAFTFGYSQKIEWVRAQLPTDTHLDLCRRPTGGGIVDHRDDWTYALVIPRGHDVEALRAVESYRLVHEALARTLVDLGQPAETKKECEPPGDGATCAATGVCFTRAERFDVIVPADGAKIAGAAQKRTKHGLLFQGSIRRAAAPAITDWDAFHDAFVDRLASALALPAERLPWPDFNEHELEGLTESYGSPEWIGQR